MKYLKCNYCGHLNEIRSEFQVFCSQCNKKLSANFSEWSKRNQGQNLNDFADQVGISANDSVQQKKSSGHSNWKSKPIKYWLAFFVAFVVFTVLGNLGAEKILSFFRSQKTEKEILEQNWIRQEYGDFGLVVETPVQLTRMELPLPENLKRVIAKIDSYKYNSAKGFQVIINSIQYTPQVGALDLQAGALGSVNEIKMQPGVTDLEYREEFISKGDIPGFLQRGKFTKDGLKVEFINAGFGSELVFWQVSLLYAEDDEVGRIASERVLKSIEIRKNSKVAQVF
jgi:hypothetical protein